MIEYKLYTKQDCAPCASLKARLHLLGLENFYTECDTHESVHRNAVIDMGFRTVPQLVCVDMSYTDDLPYVLNTSSGNAATDGMLTAFFKGFYEGWGIE